MDTKELGGIGGDAGDFSREAFPVACCWPPTATLGDDTSFGTRTYDVGWGPLGDTLHRLWVRRELARIFDFRAARLAQLFGRADSA